VSKFFKILTTFGVSQKIFIQKSFDKFHGNLTSNRADSYRHTEGRTEKRAWRSYWTIFVSIRTCLTIRMYRT